MRKVGAIAVLALSIGFALLLHAPILAIILFAGYCLARYYA